MTTAHPGIDVQERKRLGQYFTGVPLARVLAALGNSISASSLLDPMAGCGDMLVAAQAMGSATTQFTAIELDPIASTECAERLRRTDTFANVQTADAFEPATWQDQADRSWDLVITNPPYVRYQRNAKRSNGRLTIPSATDARQGLLKIIDFRENLSAEERAVFRALIEGYSGLSDLAVPSWLLCAALVAPEGRLAMVVPDTWLTRDYALPVLYLLRRLFDLEFVVEDGDACWFEDALVRTTLVVAKRVTLRPTALDRVASMHVHARLTSDASNDQSVVGALHPRSATPELHFAEQLKSVATLGTTIQVLGLDARPASDARFRDRLTAGVGTTSWGRALESASSGAGGVRRFDHDVPRRLRDIIGDVDSRLCTLDDLGWRVGQGLRTGANRFFYGELLGVDGDSSEIRVDKELSSGPIVVPTDLLRVVIRKQADLLSAHSDVRRSPGRLILLEHHALEEDIAAALAAGIRVPYTAIPEELAKYVRRAALLDVGSTNEPRLIPTLSAVSTNVRPIDAERPERLPRFWYQLPPLADRHVGLIALPRVNHGHPVPALNHHGVVIDANFSTLTSKSGSLSSYALFAVLCSTWSRAALESSGTVLGGGALKVEATQLRRLPLPFIDIRAAAELARLGEILYESGGSATSLLAAVDAVVWEAIGVAPDRRAIEDFCAELLSARNPRLGAATRSIRTSARSRH